MDKIAEKDREFVIFPAYWQAAAAAYPGKKGTAGLSGRCFGRPSRKKMDKIAEKDREYVIFPAYWQTAAAAHPNKS